MNTVDAFVHFECGGVETIRYTVLESIKAAGDWLQKKDPVTKKTWQPEQWVGVKGLEIEAFCVTMSVQSLGSFSCNYPLTQLPYLYH